MLNIYNTLTRKNERFKPLKQDEVKLYVCGPTVYNLAHIGNLKTSVVVDFVIRSLRFLGYNVKVTMNLTNVDDKTIRDSQKAGETLQDFTQKYSKIFLQDLEDLGCEKPDNIVPVTTLIPEMVRMIQTMLNRGYAYFAEDGSIYYNIKKFKNYGELANLDFSGIKNSVRINNDEYDKENASDFVLWKAWKDSDGVNFWEEKFIINGEEKIIKGRPGWHIECSACNMKYFGPQIDIHMGGEDLIFPHHQNEIAQSEACSGKTFSKYWLHSGHILVDGKKMSKSAGNFYTLHDIFKKYSSEPKEITSRALRHIFLFGKYREQVNFSFEKLENSINTIKKLSKLYTNLLDYETEITGTRIEFRQQMQIFMQDFVSALEDNFNSPVALGVYFSLVKYIGEELHQRQLSIGEVDSLVDILETFDSVFGFLVEIESEEIPQEIFELAEKRMIYKQEKNYEKADEIRNLIDEKGYKVLDNKNGFEIEKK